jgi:predicted ATPase
MDRFIVISGCSGGGKSTLLGELARRGYATVEEPGRRIVEKERASGGSALPWIDASAFARRALAMALADRKLAETAAGLVFFDRGLIDAAAALQHLSGDDHLSPLIRAHRYNRRVFLTPPWREIYAQDDARRHGFDAAVAEYDRLLSAFPAAGYQPEVLARAPVSARADAVLAAIAP